MSERLRVLGIGCHPDDLEMLSKHRSQLTWLRQHYGVDILDNVRTVARFRGLQCGVKHGKASASIPRGVGGLPRGSCPEPGPLTGWGLSCRRTGLSLLRRSSPPYGGLKALFLPTRTT